MVREGPSYCYIVNRILSDAQEWALGVRQSIGLVTLGPHSGGGRPEIASLIAEWQPVVLAVRHALAPERRGGRDGTL